MISAFELELIQSHMAQKQVLWGEVGCACVAREVSVERGGMGERKVFILKVFVFSLVIFQRQRSLRRIFLTFPPPARDGYARRESKSIFTPQMTRK